VLADRQKELLNVGYFHVVFTLPHEISWLALQNQKIVFQLLFQASAETLLEIAADPKHLGRQVGFLSVLHTWGQRLDHHPHVSLRHSRRGLSPGGQRWIHLATPSSCQSRCSAVFFRGKFVAGLKHAFERKTFFPGKSQSAGGGKGLRCIPAEIVSARIGVVYAKPPFGGPEHVLHYLARYTHRVAISNHRLIRLADGQVTFRWKDYAHGSKQREMTISAHEFLRRFVLHVLPKASSASASLASLPTAGGVCFCLSVNNSSLLNRSPIRARRKLSRWSPPGCAHFVGTMVVVERLTPQQVAGRTAGLQAYVDTS